MCGAGLSSMLSTELHLMSSVVSKEHPKNNPPFKAREIYRLNHKRVTLSRKALPTTLTDDSAIAAAAIIGDNSRPNVG